MLTVALLIGRYAAGAALLALTAFGLYKLGGAIRQAVRKVSEYYDVEKLDEAEILARKYGKKGF